MLDTNVLGTCVCTREALSHMHGESMSGHVVHVNSVAGHYVPPIPYSNMYPASKHAITALADTLRVELNHMDSHVKISVSITHTYSSNSCNSIYQPLPTGTPTYLSTWKHR